jgi:eukaryotic-like serine/threonine-protein kinase
VVDDAPRTLAHRYEFGELIGRGGMAEVHIGHDTRLGRTVAIKILRSDLARDPSFQARFRREAQAAASLNHPAIVAVYDTGEDVITDATGAVAHVPFIVMEYVEGHTVRDILRDGQAVPIEEAVEITAGVLSALEYSHHAGIVHRDIKPANVMLTPTGAVKVMDFGIARALADSAATMTQTQAVIGTAQYLSPEQARGETVDARSDLYSTGCLLFELLTGRPPFTGDSPVAVAYQHVREPAPTPSSIASDVPETLDRITLKALAKDRDSRYSSAAEFRADLENAARGGRVTAPAIGVLAAAAAAEVAAAPTTQVLAPLAPTATQVMPPSAADGSPAGAAGTTTTTTTTGPGPEEPPKRRGLMWALILLGLALVGTLIGLAILNDERQQAAATVEVPDVVDMTQEAAQQELQSVGLTMERLEEPSDTVE